MRVLLFACFKISVIVKKCICQSSCSNCVFVFSYWPTAVCCFISPDLYKSRPFFPSIFCVDRFNIWLPFTSNKANVCPFLAITWTKWMSPDVIFYQPFLTLRTLLCCLFVFFSTVFMYSHFALLTKCFSSLSPCFAAGVGDAPELQGSCG